MSGTYPALNDLLRLSLSEPVHWLSEEGAINTPVHWVATSLEEARPGDLLLVPSEQLTSKFIRQAHARGVGAILGFGQGVTLPEDAQPKGMALGFISLSGESIRDAQKKLVTLLVNQEAAMMERGARIHAQLSQLAAEGKGLEGLVKAMSEISLRGVFVQDKRGHILAQHPSSTILPFWEYLLEQLTNLNSLPDVLANRKQTGNRPLSIKQDIPGNLARLVAPIIVGEMARGYISMVGAETELDSLDSLVIEQGALVCAIEMARNKAIRETEKRLKGDLLTAILQENLAGRDAGLWLEDMGMDLSQAHVALRFAWDSPSSPSRRRLETIINGEIANQKVKAIVHPMGTEVVCFCQVTSGSSRPEAALVFGQAVLHQVAQEYPDFPGRCGVGMPAQELEDWRSSFSQAGQALEMARRLMEMKPLYYAELSVYRLLFQIEHSPELIAFQEEILGPVFASENAGEFIHTLETFFAHNGNLTQTAEALYIHRNTLIYRLERIASMLNIDLDKPENRLAVQLALYIHRMTAPLQPPSEKM